MTNGQREQHAREIAAGYGVEIRVVQYDLCPPVSRGDATGQAHGGFVALCMPRGWTQDAYFATLHEIGHCVLRHVEDGCATSAYALNTMQCEIDAWLWASEHALPLGVRARRFAVSCAKTYARRLGREDAIVELSVALNV